MKFQKLFGFASTGKVKEWQVEAIQTPEGYGIVRTTHGQLKGKMQVNDRVIKKGKNIGRSNETTPYEQALSEAESKWKKKKDENYVESIEDLKEGAPNILPMLAHPFKKRKHNIKYPCFVQPKMDGVRCLAIKEADKDVRFQSRKGKSYDATLQHLVPLLNESMRDGEILDGEIFHPDWTFQQIVSAVKALNDNSHELQFHIYDYINSEKEMDYWKRIDEITEIVGEISNPLIVKVKTIEIDDEESVYKYHDEFVQEGFEGVMIRNLKGAYQFDTRSANLQKYKQFVDKEFEIVGTTCGQGLEENCIIYICADKNGKHFNVRPRGSREDRKKKYKKREKYIGQMLTVRYQQLSDEETPIFPVGLIVRNYE